MNLEGILFRTDTERNWCSDVKTKPFQENVSKKVYLHTQNSQKRKKHVFITIRWNFNEIYDLLAVAISYLVHSQEYWLFKGKQY